MIIRSRAPLRIGLAGGGTDVSPYSDLYGGAILNATINLFAHATILPRSDNKIRLTALDQEIDLELDATETLPIDGKLDLIKGVYNRIVKDFTGEPFGFGISTFVDAPPGSGLGSSSTLVIAVLGAFVEWLNLPLGEYDIAHLAYEIERVDLGFAGGKQDQYAATFGGWNFMEFSSGDKVIVNPLRVKQEYINEIEYSLLLYYTDSSRISSTIIEKQSENVVKKKRKPVEAMHQLKRQSVMMKEAVLRGQLSQMGEILDFGWQHKKQMANGISNPDIESMYSDARAHGATGGKISGAGGGGFMILYCPENTRFQVVNALSKYEGRFQRYQFTTRGLTTWKTAEE